jgi:Tfp pilus assembly protein PilF
MKLPSAITALIAALLVLAASSLWAKDPPPFPGQPNINAALKQLNAAKEKAETDASAALASLQSASTVLAKATHNKGTFQTVARQLTERATRHLEKGETATALHEIDEAIQAVNKAGETGER